ncbi:hypothetical protein [Natrinema sp. DC36]|nr:hypothetical protein [Natrinema sp. DC36]
MDAPERRDPITGVSIERPDTPVYMPGTPTDSFTETLERIVSMVLR